MARASNSLQPPLFPERNDTLAAPRAGPITRDEARDSINDLFRRAMRSGNGRAWLRGLLTFIAGMRRYSVFNAKLIYAQRPGAVAVGTPRYWAKRGRSIRPAAVPIVIIVPRSPYRFVYEYEDTEGQPAPMLDLLFEPERARLSMADWTRLVAAAERDGGTRKGGHGFFHIRETPLGHGRDGDVHHRRDAGDRFVVRINANLDIAAKWTTLLHELAHVYCGHAGPHPRGWWPDRRALPGIHRTMQQDIREFEAEAVAWIVASRAGVETGSADYLASRVAPLDDERIDLDAVLRSANHIESIAPTAALKAVRARDDV